MLVINKGEDYATITGGFVRKGTTADIEKWEYGIICALGADFEILEQSADASKTIETPKAVKKKKK